MKPQPLIDPLALASISTFKSPVLDHQGKRVAYYSDLSGKNELFVLNLETGQSQCVSSDEQGRTTIVKPVWSRDGEKLIFAKDDGGNEQYGLHILDLSSGEVTDIDTPEGQNIPIEVSPDNSTLTFNNVSRKRQMNLWVAPLSGGSPKRLTEHTQPVHGGYWHPDGDWIVFGANESDNYENGDFYRINPSGEEKSIIFSIKEGSLDGGWPFDQSGKTMAVASNASGQWQPGVMDWENNEIKWFGDKHTNESPTSISPNGKQLLTIKEKDGASTPLLYDLEKGTSRQLTLPAGVVSMAEFIDDETLFLSHQDPQSASRLLVYELAEDTFEEALCPSYGELDSSTFSPGEHVYFESTDGLKIGAILHLPDKERYPGKRPGILCVHGGPNVHRSLGFNPLCKLLTDSGYVVLEPNYRGSTGYGKEFSEKNRKDLGGGDVQDLVAGANFLKTQELVLENKVAIMGGSYGGYLTYQAMVTQPELWAAGIAIVGITDWKLLYDTSAKHFQTKIEQLFGPYETTKDLLKDRSPLTRAHQLKAPLLMVQGQNDPRCPVEQARVFKDKLLELGKVEGKDFEYLELEDIGHGSTLKGDKAKLWRRYLDYLAKHLY